MAPSEIEPEAFRPEAPPPILVGITSYYILRVYAYVKDQLFVRYAVTDNTPNVRNLTY